MDTGGFHLNGHVRHCYRVKHVKQVEYLVNSHVTFRSHLLCSLHFADGVGGAHAPALPAYMAAEGPANMMGP